jgi:hypothetical protein
MRFFILMSLLTGLFASVNAQKITRQLPSKRTTATFKIDGELNEPQWKEASPATDFIEWRPSAGNPEENKTIVYILYDNTAVYVGGYCYEKTKDSVSRELIGRDRVGINDFVGVIFDTYNDKINAVGFYVTPYGEQYDAKYSNSGNEDDSWNSVWRSEAKIHNDGWSFEMRIPYSCFRFVTSDNQTWGLNITRKRTKSGKQYMWNPIDPKVNGFINQEGEWTGISKIEAPVRLSFSPYLSGYINHYPDTTAGAEDWATSVNGGMDVKYGISESFTLDMTLIPDFGQVRSDNKVLNLSAFETRYGEQRPFFTEGTELFNKGNLFYSRRVGDFPINYGLAYSNLNSTTGEKVIENPQAAKLINATKLSGRTKKGLGIGLFNAVTKRMYAVIEDKSGNKRKVETSPLTNYNIIVLDQSLKNNSSVSLINTNTLRDGSQRDANVTAGMFNLNNKKNTYNFNGKLSVSQIMDPDPLLNNYNGFATSLGFGKTGGRWNWQLSQEINDDKYDINDLGALYNNNSIDHYFWSGYRWLKPTKWYNNIQLNWNVNHSVLYKKFPNQVLDTKFQSFSTNVNANGQLKNLWYVGMFVGYIPQGNDFYETRVNRGVQHYGDKGLSFISTERFQFETWFESNNAKKYSFSFSYFVGLRDQFNSQNHFFNFSHKYRFNDKFSLSHRYYLNPFSNDGGFSKLIYELDGSGNRIPDGKGGFVVKDVVIERRDRMTVENSLEAKYNFSKRSGITLTARHYWSKVNVEQLYDLNPDGSVSATKHTSLPLINQNFNVFNIDAQYTLEFAPGSFIYVVWKDQSEYIQYGTLQITDKYLNNFGHTISAPQNNNLSLKIVYYLDYLDFKKWGKKKG